MAEGAFDLKTFIESTCRTCSGIDSGDGKMQFHRIFNEPPELAEDKDGEEKKPFSELLPTKEVGEVFEEFVVWNLDVKPNDGLPQQLCTKCLEHFRNIKYFREDALDTQKVLRSCFKHLDIILDTGSLGRQSPKSESVRSEPRASPAPSSFNPEDLVEEVPESPERQQQNSPGGSPKYQLSPQSHDVVYAESSLGTPPPLFEEFKTEPIDMQTMDFLKTETEIESEKKLKIENADNSFQLAPASPVPFHFSRIDDFDSQNSSDNDSETESNAYESQYEPRNPLQCKICFAIFPKRLLLKEHHRHMHPQEKPYVCNVCSSAFKSNFLLTQHKLKHNRRDSIKCKQCGKYFRSQLHLQRHTKNFHLTSTFSCHICHKKFENYTQIRFTYHVRQHGEKRFHCQYCDKSFHQKIHLINHERTHTKEQPFSCDICGKAYRQQTACQEHMLTHQDPTPFKCKICKKGFTQRSSLRLHYRTHTRNTSTSNSFACDLCGQNFKQKIHLEAHKLTHSSYCGSSAFALSSRAQSPRSYKCQFCDKSFQKKQLQILHEQQHSKEQLFKCNFCEESFRYRSALGQHMLAHLEEDKDNPDEFFDYNFTFNTSI